MLVIKSDFSTLLEPDKYHYITTINKQHIYYKRLLSYYYEKKLLFFSENKRQNLIKMLDNNIKNVSETYLVDKPSFLIFASEYFPTKYIKEDKSFKKIENGKLANITQKDWNLLKKPLGLIGKFTPAEIKKVFNWLIDFEKNIGAIKKHNDIIYAFNKNEDFFYLVNNYQKFPVIHLNDKKYLSKKIFTSIYKLFENKNFAIFYCKEKEYSLNHEIMYIDKNKLNKKDLFIELKLLLDENYSYDSKKSENELVLKSTNELVYVTDVNGKLELRKEKNQNEQVIADHFLTEYKDNYVRGLEIDFNILKEFENTSFKIYKIKQDLYLLAKIIFHNNEQTFAFIYQDKQFIVKKNKLDKFTTMEEVYNYITKNCEKLHTDFLIERNKKIFKEKI